MKSAQGFSQCLILIYRVCSVAPPKEHLLLPSSAVVTVVRVVVSITTCISSCILPNTTPVQDGTGKKGTTTILAILVTFDKMFFCDKKVMNTK